MKRVLVMMAFAALSLAATSQTYPPSPSPSTTTVPPTSPPPIADTGADVMPIVLIIGVLLVIGLVGVYVARKRADG